MVAALDVPVPFDVRKLCADIAARRGRPIRLCAMAMPADSPCGVWIAAADSDYIVYEAETTRLHQDHIIVHEIGHLLSDHHTTTVLEPDTSRLLLPSLDPALVNRVLGRTHYSAAEEQEAELVASLILQQASYWHPASDWAAPGDNTGIGRRLGSTLERPDHRNHV